MIKNYLTLITLLMFSCGAMAQGVGINISGGQPHASSMLDVESTDKGLLIPRLALSSTNVAAPVTNPETSLLVYNTVAAGTGTTAVTPGFYYWDGTQWVKMVAGPIPTGTDDQNLTGATLTGATLQIDIENGNSASVDLTGIQDGTGTDDQNLLMSTALDSILIEDGAGVSLNDVGTGLTSNPNFVTNLSDSLVTNTNLIGNVYDSIINNNTWIDQLQDSINTDDQTLTLTGTNLSIEDGNTVNLNSLQDGTGTDDQNLTGATLTGTTLQIDIENGTSASVNLAALQDGVNDADAVIGNEYNTGVTLIGTTLNIIDGGGAQSINLAPLQDGVTDADADPNNEYNTSAVLNGTDLEITDGGGTQTVDLSSLAGGNDAWKLTGNAGTTPGTNFIGTTDNQDLVFKRNGIKSGLLGRKNASFGYQSFINNTSWGEYNSAFGVRAMESNTNGGSNIAFGYDALRNNTIGSYNVAIGREALKNSNLASPFSSDFSRSSVAIGYASLSSNVTGMSNIAIGNQTLLGNSDGHLNIAIGIGALKENVDGDQNIGIGYQALYKSTAHYNTAIGSYAMGNNAVSGGQNVALGAGAFFNNVDGAKNTMVGASVANQVSSGDKNTAVGHLAMKNNEGDNNVSIGERAFDSGASTTFYNQSTAIGSNTQINGSNSSVFGYGASVLVDNKIRLGNTVVDEVETEFLYTTVSDGRFKKEVKANVPGLEFITQLRPVTYYFDVSKHNEFLNMPDSLVDHEAVKLRESELRSGFIAQEIEQVAKNIGYEFDGVVIPENEGDHYSVSYTQIIVPLVKAVQEQQEIILRQQQEIHLLMKWLANNEESFKKLADEAGVMIRKDL